MPFKHDIRGAMEQFESRFKQVDVLPLVKHYMDELDLFNLFTSLNMSRQQPVVLWTMLKACAY